MDLRESQLRVNLRQLLSCFVRSMKRLLAAPENGAEQPETPAPDSQAQADIEQLLHEAQNPHQCHARRLQPPLEALDVEQAEHMRRIEIFEQYRSWQEIYTPKEWEAIWLCYHEGLSDIEAARALRKTRSTISSRLTAARRKKDRQEEKLRHEKLEWVRESDRQSS